MNPVRQVLCHWAGPSFGDSLRSKSQVVEIRIYISKAIPSKTGSRIEVTNQISRREKGQHGGTALIPALWRQKQGDLCGSEADLL